jgi:hypothetical protein
MIGESPAGACTISAGPALSLSDSG